MPNERILINSRMNYKLQIRPNRTQYWGFLTLLVFIFVVLLCQISIVDAASSQESVEETIALLDTSGSSVSGRQTVSERPLSAPIRRASDLSINSLFSRHLRSDCWGNDIDGTDGNLQDCARKCEDLLQCVAFVHSRRENKCWRKKECVNLRTKDQWDTYILKMKSGHTRVADDVTRRAGRHKPEAIPDVTRPETRHLDVPLYVHHSHHTHHLVDDHLHHLSDYIMKKIVAKPAPILHRHVFQAADHNQRDRSYQTPHENVHHHHVDQVNVHHHHHYIQHVHGDDGGYKRAGNDVIASHGGGHHHDHVIITNHVVRGNENSREPKMVDPLSFLPNFTHVPGATCNLHENAGSTSIRNMALCAQACHDYGRSCVAYVIERATTKCWLKTTCKHFVPNANFDLYVALNKKSST